MSTQAGSSNESVTHANTRGAVVELYSCPCSLGGSIAHQGGNPHTTETIAASCEAAGTGQGSGSTSCHAPITGAYPVPPATVSTWGTGGHNLANAQLTAWLAAAADAYAGGVHMDLDLINVQGVSVGKQMGARNRAWLQAATLVRISTRSSAPPATVWSLRHMELMRHRVGHIIPACRRRHRHCTLRRG